MNRIWKRYYLSELAKVFLLFICSFYFLYVLIDYSAHSKAFHSESITLFDIGLYYLCQFTKRAEILIPIALLVAEIKVLTSASTRNEILALATGGIGLKKIMHPFLFAAILSSLFLYCNFQFLQPFSLGVIQSFEEANFKDSSRQKKAKEIHALSLQDNSLLIFQNFEASRQAFYDVFWLKNEKDIFRMRSLYPFRMVPLGEAVEHLTRTTEKETIKSASYEHLEFPDMHFEENTLFDAIHPPRQQSITQLASHFSWLRNRFGIGKMSDREAEICTYFYYKLTIPLVSILAVIGSAPFCLLFKRQFPLLMVYSLSMFGMLSFFTLVNSSLILGESQVIPPLLAIIVPQLLFFLICGWKYAKI